MEPATLYLLYKFGGETKAAKELPFNSVTECQEFFDRRVRPSKTEVVRYSCSVYTVGSKPPDWYTDHFDQKYIYGVPLDAKYR